MFENDLNEFIAVEKKNHLLYHLKKDIREKFQIIMNMLIIRNQFAALIQRIKNSQTFKVDFKNKL